MKLFIDIAAFFVFILTVIFFYSSNDNYINKFSSNNVEMSYIIDEGDISNPNIRNIQENIKNNKKLQTDTNSVNLTECNNNKINFH